MVINNSKLLNAFKLSSKLTVYVPATTNVNEVIDNTKYVNECENMLSKCFGGATSTPVLGYWLSPANGLVKENTMIVFAYCSEKDLQQNIDKVVEYCEQLKQELAQDAIAIEINGEMYFI